MTTILVVDDDPAITGLLVDLLNVDGHEAETAANGLLALDKLRERAYDLILCDIKMPKLNGEGLYREVARRHPEFCRRFIFVTGSAFDPETKEFLKQTGAPTINKPFCLDEIRRIVRQALGAA